MSKSKGNLVFVSALRRSDVDPMAIRLVLLRHHYRSDWEWTDDQLWDAVDTLDAWRRALALGAGAARGPARRARCSPRSPTTSTPRPRVAAVQELGRRHARHDRLATPPTARRPPTTGCSTPRSRLSL